MRIDHSARDPAAVADERDTHIAALGFPPWTDVSGRKSIADLFRAKARRSGIYILGFADGARYVGRAVDVVRRFGQHQKNHADIVLMTFQRVAKRDQAETERTHIHALESQGLRLRNIAEMSVIIGERDIDDLIPPADQERWLANATQVADDGDRVADAAVRYRYRQRFEKFRQLELADAAVEILGRYLNAALPAPKRTEQAFWSMSCLPGSGTHLLSRMNLNMQEVLTLTGVGLHVRASFHLAITPFRHHLGPGWAHALHDRNLSFTEHLYKPGGRDQFHIEAHGISRIRALLEWDVARQAIRTLNLNLMRKGPSYWANNHCFDLADAVFDASRSEELGPVAADRPRLRRTASHYRSR